MKVVGLTGGIGCGKTTVLNEFRQLGVPCFVADEVAGTYYNDPDFVSEVEGLLSVSVRRPDGSVDKKKIADIVFRDAEQLSRLNSLIHPRVRNDFACWCRQQQEQGAPYVILESAILYEYGLDLLTDAVICVYLDAEERMRRLQIRDNASPKQITDRMRNQLPAEQKMSQADYVVLNYEGNPRKRQVHWIHQAIMRSL